MKQPEIEVLTLCAASKGAACDYAGCKRKGTTLVSCPTLTEHIIRCCTDDVFRAKLDIVDGVEPSQN